ncbi:MAG: LysR family transcriptional regulator [Pseudomonadota bacterium]
MKSGSDKRLDWAWLEAFQSVAQHRSLSAAARASGLSQPTLSRHIAALEQTLGVTLFDRTSKGLTLAPAGRGLVEHADAMLNAAHRFTLHAQGQTQSIAGTVRITASEVVSAYLLPPLIAKLRQYEPSIQVEIFASNRSGNLLQREADIALRMYQPTQLDVITRKLGQLHIGLYASHDYLKRHPAPGNLHDFTAHQLVGYDANDQMIEGYRSAGARP